MYFTRSQLAEDMCEALQGSNLFNDAPNGLFLAAPRRTGKSTFLQADLKPALERRGVAVVYVDLWAAPQRDPGELIAEAIGRALRTHLGPIAKAAKASGLESISIAGALKIDTSKIGRPEGATLTDALRTLHELAKAPVALLVDEAQHSLTSEAGENAMTALKSARDQLNRPGLVNLMLVMSGSDRDKLLRLVNANAAPFYGSSIKHLPLLGDDFVAHLAGLIEKQRPDLKPVEQALLTQAFQTLGHRPQFFIDTLGEALSPFGSGEAKRFESRVVELALQRLEQDRQQMESDYLALRTVEQAVIWRMLEQGPRFRPYDAEALRFYSDKTGTPITRAMAQKAMEALRNRQPSMVWKSARGEYAIDDAAMHQWYQQRVALGAWPPEGPRWDEDEA
ncbi:ATP-binding protein [Aquabacterium sp.]|uniref:ATP-binding protein n=1 Tax=Aquabacterium sp. TaxID=1872578 RepID=UPI003BAF65AD